MAIASLYVAGLGLPSVDVLYDGGEEDTDEPYEARPTDPDRITPETWREIHDSLAQHFGDANWYREVFDPYEPMASEPEVVGSLADDTADIYVEAVSGLKKWQRGESSAALWEWRFGLENHWGEHATSALRALHMLASRHDNDVGFPVPQ